MKIFISYAREDKASILELVQSLSIHDVWFDQSLQVGQDWWAEIERQIAGCDCFMFIISPDSVVSEYCQKEIAQARKLDKPIVPVLLRACEVPKELSKLQILSVVEGMTPASTASLLNGLFEIERQVFNPLRPRKDRGGHGTTRLSLNDLFFATTSTHKQRVYAQILGAQFQSASLNIRDVQHVEVGEVAIYKAQEAHHVLHKPVFAEHSGLVVRAWGGLPGGLTGTFIVPLGLNDFCRMLDPFPDRYAEAVYVIAFTDGVMIRKFTGVVPGGIASEPRGSGYYWDNIFIPEGFSTTLGEMSDEEYLAVSGRRRAMIAFMRFLQANYLVQ